MKFRKKPVVIDAVCVMDDNIEEVKAFLGESRYHWAEPQKGMPVFVIETLEGDMLAPIGNWIIRGVKGEFYPCKPDIFAATYEPEKS